MTYWWFLFAIAAFTAAVSLASQRQEVVPPTPGQHGDSTQKGMRSTFYRYTLSITLLLAGIFTTAVAFQSVNEFLSSEIWYDRSPYKELIMFGLMGIGMLARIVSEAVEERRKARAKLKPGEAIPAIHLSGWDLLYPFLSSSICFGALFESVGHKALDFAILLLAFQNGFFWQTIVGGARPK